MTDSPDAAVMARIDRALGRIEAAVRALPPAAAQADLAAANAGLAAKAARLETATRAAIERIDSLIEAYTIAGEPDPA